MQRTIRFAGGAIGLGGFLWFLLPMPIGIINIGNLTGVLVFGTLLLYFIKQRSIHQGLSRLWHTVGGKIGIVAVALPLTAIAATAVLLSTLMVSAALQVPSQPSTVVVLGCQVSGDRPSQMLRERLDTAYAYLAEHPESRCIVSGGQGTGEDISEAECMYRYLTAKGIAPERIWREDRSTSTRENLLFASRIIQEQQWEPSVAIASNEFHEYRAGVIADKLGMAHHSLPAATTWWLFPTYWVREMYGILYEWIL